MAQRVTVVLEDDVDGTTADEQVSFGLDGTEYEIDLSSKNARALREALSPWIGHARKSASRRRGGGGRATASRSSGGPSAGEIRAWAERNNMEVNSRGRIPAEVREAYLNANK